MPPETPPDLMSALFSPRMGTFWLGFAFLLGLLWGSFFNVCIYRLPMGLSPNRPRRSFCFSCGTSIAWYDNIPLLSWIFLGGRCRHCGAPIRFRYFAIEFITGVVFALLWWSTNRTAMVEARGFSASIIWYWAVGGMLIVGAMTDIDHWIIPDGITRGGLWVALAVALMLPWISPDTLIAHAGPFPAVRRTNLADPVEAIGTLLGVEPDREQGRGVWEARARNARDGRVDGETQPEGAAERPKPSLRNFHWWEPPANALLGAVAGYGFLWAIAFIGRFLFRREAMGGGDLKLFGFLGAVFGPFNVILLVFFSSFVGVILGVTAILWSALRPPQGVRITDLWMPRKGTGDNAGPGTDAPTSGGVTEDAAATAEGAKSETDVPAPAPSQRDITIREYLIYAAKRPERRHVHHIPFGPSISLAAMIFLIFYHPIHNWLVAYLLPAFGG